MARHNQFRARDQHLNLTDMWDQACMGLRGEGGSAEIINETVTGFVSDIGANAVEINNIGQILNWYADPFTLEIVSDTASDNQFIQITYINANGGLTEEVIQIDGTTPVQVDGVQVFIFARNAGGFQFQQNGQAITFPDNGVIEGPVYFYKQGATPGNDGDTFGEIDKSLDLGGGLEPLYAGQRTFGTHQSVPAGYSAYVKGIQPWAGKNDEIIISVQVKPRKSNNWSTEIPISGVESLNAGESNWRYLPEGFDVRVMANRPSGGSAAVMMQYQLLLIKNKA